MKAFWYGMRTYDTLEIAKQLSAETGISLGWSVEAPDERNVGLSAGCELVCVAPCAFPVSLIETMARQGCKALFSAAIGYDFIDLSACRRLGLKVYNASYPPEGVADYTVMLMLMALRKMKQVLERTKLQDYSLEGKIGRSLSDCTVGVIGTGRIGRAVIQRLSGFGSQVLCYDIHQSGDLPYVSLEELLERSDVVTLHVNATGDNFHLLNKERLALMKRNAVLVNCARGQLVDTSALVDALLSGGLGGAALDTWEGENGRMYYNRVGKVLPDKNLAILSSLPNVILSPHAAFYTERNMELEIRSVFEGMVAFRDGKESEREVRL